MKSPFTWFKEHPVISGLLGIVAAGSIYAALPRTEYQTLAEAEVLEERIVRKWSESPAAKAENADERVKAGTYYLLHLSAREGNEKVFYSLHVRPSESLPVEVLEEVIQEGSTVIFPYWKESGGKPQYDVTRFGTIEASAIRVVRPWESSEKVMEEHQAAIEHQRRIEENNRRMEMREYVRSGLF